MKQSTVHISVLIHPTKAPYRPRIVVHSEVVGPRALGRVIEAKLLELAVEFCDQSVITGFGEVALFIQNGHHT